MAKNLIAASVNLSVMAGTTADFSLDIRDFLGDSADASGFTVSCFIQKYDGETEKVDVPWREASKAFILTVPELQEGRYAFELQLSDDSGELTVLAQGWIGVFGRIGWSDAPVSSSPNRTLLIRRADGKASIEAQWMATGAAEGFAKQAQASKEAAEQAKADAESTLGEVRAVQEDIGQSVQFVAGLTNDAEAAKNQAESAAESARGYSTSAESSMQGAQDAKSGCEAALAEVNDAVQSFAGVVAAEKAASIAAIEEAGAAAKAEVSEIAAGVQGAVDEANASADAAEAAQNKAQEIADGVNAILEEAAQEAAQKEVADIHEQFMRLVGQALTYERQAAGHASFADSYAREALGFRDAAEKCQVATKGYRDEVKGYVDNVTTMHGEVTAADARVSEAVSSIDAKVTAAVSSIDAKVTAAESSVDAAVSSIDAKVSAVSETIDAGVAASLAERVNVSGFYRMTQAEYDALETRPADAVYFIGEFS